jgi:endonuclease/exonuclease/phosphatase family metal-dependent hydrolase
MKRSIMLALKSNASCLRLPLSLLSAAAALTITLTLPATAGPDDHRGPAMLGVFTANIYVGGDIGRAISADPSDPMNLVAAVTGVYADIVASNPPARMKALAKQIAKRSPEMVALQEVSLIRFQSPGDLGATPATTVVFDYLELLQTELHALGADYRVASTAQQIDVEMPMLASMVPLVIADVRLTDRDVILVRNDRPRGHLQVSNAQHGNFENVLQIPTIGLTIERGWCSVDVAVRGRKFRFVCAHLEQETAPTIQAAQAGELLAGPVNTRLPVILAGDFNADALHRDGSFTYDLMPEAGLVDTWAQLHPRTPKGGLTWGHDDLLADPGVRFDRRIDFIFHHGKGLVPICSNVVDVTTGLRPSPRWASDHAAVTATFLVK